jgi:hypothetical protein
VTTQTPIHDVIRSLEGLGLKVTFCEKNENVPFDVAIASLGLDEKNRPLTLQVQQYSQNIVTALAEVAEGTESQSTDLQMLGFLLTVPIDIPQETVPEVLRLLALANKSFPLGALNFSEIEKAVYFSYGYPVFSTPPDDMTILMIINTILFAKDSFFPTIDEVASARQTVDTLIGEKG